MVDILSRLDSDQSELRETVANLAAARARQWDFDHSPLPYEERKLLGEHGLLGISLPEQHCGAGRPLADALVVIEELAKVNPIAAWPVVEACTGPARVIELFGSEEQKATFLPPVVAGDKRIAGSLSEPEAGSAVTDMTTRGRIHDDDIIVNGVKRWCSGAGHSEQYLVYLRLEDSPGAQGIGAIIVDKDTEGVSFGPQERLIGFQGLCSADIYFDDARIPATNLIVPAGGFSQPTAFSIERLGNATISLAIGQSALDRTARHITELRQFGRQIAEFQHIQGMFADMIVRVEAARSLIYTAAGEAGNAAPSPLAASIAKCNANEMAKIASELVMKLHGEYGYSAEYDVERLHRDAHGWSLAGGTLTIQRVRIASEYLGIRFNQRKTRAEAAHDRPDSTPTTTTVDASNLKLETRRAQPRHVLRAPKYPSSVSVYDARGRTRALPTNIKALTPDMRVFAPAFPVRAPQADSWWLQRAVDAADRGEILVVDVGDGTDYAYFDEALVEAAISRKLAGLIINARVRGYRRLAQLSWPIFAQDSSDGGTRQDSKQEGELGEPVFLGNTRVALGDLIVGDADGVVCIPATEAENLISLTKDRARNEQGGSSISR
jgi:alkylation response protein AidB-like acyl-CoA dehydrogenase/regulator of RNase E activity RraA